MSPSSERSDVDQPAKWRPLLCRLALHRWRTGFANSPRGLFRCERCGAERMGAVATRVKRPPAL